MMKIRNMAFIDAQNLTQNMKNDEKPWKIDLIKFRVFLKEKYKVDKAFYFIGIRERENEKLYKFLHHVGYDVVKLYSRDNRKKLELKK